MSPDIVYKLVAESGFTVVKSSLDLDESVRKENMYFSRDILLVIKSL